MIVRVRVGRLVVPAAPGAGDLRAVQSAVAAAVQQHVARATLGRGPDAATIAVASRAVGAEVAARCSARPHSRP